MTHKILIVDDDVNVLFVIKAALAPHYEVLTAPDGEAGLEIIKKENPSFVFLDITMPGISGVQVLGMLKDLGLAPVVWMLTGSEDLDTAALTLKGGASGYLTKPFDMERLRNIVFNALLDLENTKVESRAGDKPWRVEKKK